MKKIKFDLEKMSIWMQDYFEKNKVAPDISEIKISNGSPFNKTVALREFDGDYQRLCNACGIPSRKEKSEHLANKLSEELFSAVFKYRTTDRDFLRKNAKISDRSRYERIFGSWSKALEYSGITKNKKYLILNFPEYNNEDEISFIKSIYGENNKWNNQQIEVIQKVKELNGDIRLINKNISRPKIKKLFGNSSIMRIASGYEVTQINFKRNYKAKDGHECDSLSEVEIDDWLYENNIKHDVHVPYPKSNMICDFKVGDVYIEYFGMKDFYGKIGQKYNQKIKRKTEFCKKNKIKFFHIYKINEKVLRELKEALDDELVKQALN